MIWLLLALSVLLIVWLLQAPLWLRTALFTVGALLTTGLVLLSGPERALVPVLVFALGLGLLLPGGTVVTRRRKVAPRSTRRERAARAASGGKGGLEAIEIPGFEILEKVGSGGMAGVYRARKLSNNRIVALKIPMEQYVADAKFIRRFHREAEVAQRLDHPNIVRTFEHGSMGVRHYMAMEYVKGRSLESYIEAGELDAELSIEIMKLVVGALQHIHSAGIIHRDIKPGNIMILEGGISEKDGKTSVAPDAVKLMDFGIAGGKMVSRLTMTGARIGTPVYMSPEQARGLKLDHRSDIYSLGLVFYEMLTGSSAFKGGYDAIVHQQIFQTPPPPRQVNLGVPRALDELVMKMVAKEADERPSLEAVADVLGRIDLDEKLSSSELPSRIVLAVNAQQGVVRVLDTEGTLHSSTGEIGGEGGSFSVAPLSISVDSKGNFYAALFQFQVGQSDHQMIHKFTPDGQRLLAFGGYGIQPGELLYPVSLAVAPDDTLYVLDAEAHSVQRFAADGSYIMSFGSRGAAKGQFNEPRVITVGPDGDVYVLDYGNRRVQRFSPDGEYRTRWAFRMSADDESLRVLDGLALDSKGNVYIGDAHASKVRKLSPEGKVAGSFPLPVLQTDITGEVVNEALLDLGVDDIDYLYAVRRGGTSIQKFDPSGRLIGSIDTYAPVSQMLLDVRAPRQLLTSA